MRYNAKVSFARMLCEDAGISLSEDPNSNEVKLSYSGGRYHIQMPALDAAWTDDDPRAIWWWGTFCSMIDRVQPSTSKLELQAANTYSINTIFGQVLTRVLATNATSLNMGVYQGKDDWVLNSMDQDGVLLTNTLEHNPPTDKNDIAMSVTNLFDQLAKSVQYGTIPGEYPPYQDKLQEMVDDDDLVLDYNKPHTSIFPLIKVTKRILEHLELDPEEEEEKSKQQREQEKEGEQGEGEGSAQQGEKADAGDEESDGSAYANTVNFKDLSLSGDGSKGGANLTINYDEGDLYSNDTYIPTALEIQTDMGRHRSGSNPYNSDKLSKQIANLLKVRSQVRYVGGKKNGRIRNRSLARAGSDPFYDTPFRKKESNDVLDTCVLLLVDTSGSMSGTRYALATESAIKLSEVLGSVHIPNAVIGFNQRSTNHIMIHKDFSDKPNADVLYNNLQAGSEHWGGNDDAISLDWCYDHICKQKQKRKIIIVLSDGQPAAHAVKGNCAAYLKEVASKVERSIDLFAIGIQTHSVSQFYSNSKVLSNVQDLEQTVLNVIKDKVI